MWKQFISDYLNFTKKERNGTIVLLSLITILVIIPFLFPFFIKRIAIDHKSFDKEIASLNIKQLDTAANYQRRNYDDDRPAYYQPQERNSTAKQQWKGELFNFDPNLLPESGWKKLGVRDKTIATIKNYLSKGGKFYKPEDIRKIWGLNDEEKERLEPYIKIESAAREHTYQIKTYDRSTTEKPKYTPSVIDVNVADTTAFIALPGIGSKLSQRIISFREKLGGFYKAEQVGETFGLPDSTFQKIKSRFVLNNPVVKKLNINTSTLDELKSHPYIRYGIANAIIQYRSQHGKFGALGDLKKVILITDEVYDKLLPYLKME